MKFRNLLLVFLFICLHNLYSRPQDLKDENIILIPIFNSILEYSNIGKQLLELDEDKLIEYSEELFRLVPLLIDEEVIAKLAKILQMISEDQWSTALNKDTYLISLAIALQEKSKEFTLDNKYKSALFKFSTSEKEIELSNWQKDNWIKLVSLLNESHLRVFSRQLTDYFLDNYKNISTEFIASNRNYLLADNFLSKKGKLESMIIDYLEQNEYENLKLINDILKKEQIENIDNLDKHSLNAIKDSLQDKVNSMDGADKEILYSIADLLGIVIEGKEDESK